MDRIETAARVSVFRGSAFALLAIVCFMVGLAGTPALSFKFGGIFCLFVCFVLIAKAELAPNRPYKRTEVWLMLEPPDRPPAPVAQRLIGMAVQGHCREFALQFARGSVAMLVTSLVLPAQASIA
jgi:hypothetical protein